MKQHKYWAPVLTAVLLSFGSQAQAREIVSFEVLADVGTAIAMQGNIAFQEIRADLKRDIERKFNEWLTQGAATKSVPAGKAGLDDYVQMHAQLRQAAAGAN